MIRTPRGKRQPKQKVGFVACVQSVATSPASSTFTNASRRITIVNNKIGEANDVY